jgi:hypothetical protein
MFRRFAFADESGAVSADWLALGAGLVAMSMAIAATFTEGTATLGENTGDTIRTAEVTPIGSLGWSD